MTEQALQELVAAYLDLWGVCWCHVPNGGQRTARAGRMMKRAGTKAGVPDVLIFEPWWDDVGGRIGGMGTAIELKVNTAAGKKTYPRPEQRKWMADLEIRGWRVAVCRSLAEVQEQTQWLRPLNGRAAPY